MVAAAATAAARMAGQYILAKGKKAAYKVGKKIVKKGVKAAVGAVSGATGVKFSKDKGAKGSVQMVKKGMTKSKGTHAGAYLPAAMKSGKEALTRGLGGPAYAAKKMMTPGNALSYSKIGGLTKTRK